MNTRNAMEKGQTASRYVSVCPREAVNKAGGEAITVGRALLSKMMENQQAGRSIGDRQLIRLVVSPMSGVSRAGDQITWN